MVVLNSIFGLFYINLFLLRETYTVLFLLTFQFFISVAKYTREAGVRNLERQIGAICRAVAVKVAEGDRKEKQTSISKDTESDSLSEGNDQTDMDAIDIGGLTSVTLPPEMPIVVDEHAVEDILGVILFFTFTC